MKECACLFPAEGKRTKLQSDDMFNMREKPLQGQPHCCGMLGDTVSYKTNLEGEKISFSFCPGLLALWSLAP